MKVLLYTGRFPQRSETFVYRQATALARAGHDVMVVCRDLGDTSLYEHALPPTMSVIELPPDTRLRNPFRAFTLAKSAAADLMGSPAKARRLWAACLADASSDQAARRQFVRHLPFNRFDPDVIHFEFLSGRVLYPLAGRIDGTPVVVSCRGQDVHTLELRNDTERADYISSLQRADLVHCVSDELAREVARIAGRGDGVWVNRPAIDVDAIVPRPKSIRERIHIVTSGRLTWVKGYDYLLTAFAELRRRGVEFTAEILGEGELATSLRFSIFDLGLRDCVQLAGGVTPREALARLQDADVFVLASVAEGISNAVLEAMAAGIPVVTANAGGMSEAVTDGCEGLVVPIRDSKALADAIGRLAAAPALRTRMGAAARLRACNNFSLSRQLAVFEQMYDSAIRKRRAS